MAAIALLVLSLVPRDVIPEDNCGVLMLNHIWSASLDPWNQVQVNVWSYWLGWRDDGEFSVVDWWRQYNGESVDYVNGRPVMFLLDDKYPRQVVVRPKRFIIEWSEYDIELDQRQELERLGYRHLEYRRGLAGRKPQ